MSNSRNKNINYKGSHFEPVYEYWSKQPTILVWEAAYLMHGVEPRLASDLLVRDPLAPEDPYGIPLDIEHECKLLGKATRVGLIRCTGTTQSQDAYIELSMESLTAWLDNNDYSDLSSSLRDPSSQKSIVPLQRGAAQQAIILTEIGRLGHDPKKLPAFKTGKSGVKSQVRDALRNHPLFQGTTVFDKAWEELRKAGDIK